MGKYGKNRDSRITEKIGKTKPSKYSGYREDDKPSKKEIRQARKKKSRDQDNLFSAKKIENGEIPVSYRKNKQEWIDEVMETIDLEDEEADEKDFE